MKKPQLELLNGAKLLLVRNLSIIELKGLRKLEVLQLVAHHLEVWKVNTI